MEKEMAKDESLEKVFKLMEELEKAKKPAIEELLAKRAEIDAKLSQLGYNLKVSSTGQKRAPKTCSNCGQQGHTARKCPSKPKA